MHRLFKQLNPLLSAFVIASFLTPSIVNAQGGGWIRGYYDFFDNLCYACTGPMESNEFCTCSIRQT